MHWLDRKIAICFRKLRLSREEGEKDCWVQKEAKRNFLKIPLAGCVSDHQKHFGMVGDYTFLKAVTLNSGGRQLQLFPHQWRIWDGVTRLELAFMSIEKRCVSVLERGYRTYRNKNKTILIRKVWLVSFFTNRMWQECILQWSKKVLYIAKFWNKSSLWHYVQFMSPDDRLQIIENIESFQSRAINFNIYATIKI